MPPRPFSGLSGRTSDPGRSRGILQTRPKPQKASASFLRLVVFIASEALPADKLPLAAVDDDPFRSFKKTILSSRLAQTPRRSVHRKHAGRRSTDRRHHARASLQTVRRALNIDMHQFNRAVMPAQEHISSAKLFTNTFFFFVHLHAFPRLDSQCLVALASVLWSAACVRVHAFRESIRRGALLSESAPSEESMTNA